MLHSVLCGDRFCSLLGTACTLCGICGAVLCLPVWFSSDMACGHCRFTDSSLPTEKQNICMRRIDFAIWKFSKSGIRLEECPAY